MRRLNVLLAFAGAAAALPTPSLSQDRAPFTAEQVTYPSSEAGLLLAGALTLPQGPGPFPGVVVLSLAGTDDLIDALVGAGYAVLVHERRHFLSPAVLLGDTYQDLANDALSAIEYLAARPEVDSAAVGLLGQGEDSPPATLAAAGPSPPAFVMLMSPRGLPGPETFRIEQLSLAESQGYSPARVSALDEYIDGLTRIVLTERTPEARAFRLYSLVNDAEIQLPFNAGLPTSPVEQVDFFISPLWVDRLSFQPDQAFARIDRPVLVLMGLDDPATPPVLHLPPIRRSLEAAPTEDVTVCVIAERTAHSFAPDALAVLRDWLLHRIPPAGRQPLPERAGEGALAVCVEESELPR